MVESVNVPTNRIKDLQGLRYRVKRFIAENHQKANIQGIAEHLQFQRKSIEYDALKMVVADLVEKGDIKRKSSGYYFIEQNIGFVLVKAVKDTNTFPANDRLTLVPLSWPEQVGDIAAKPQTISIQQDSSIPLKRVNEGDVFLARISYDSKSHNRRAKGYKANLLEPADKELVGTLKIASDGTYFVKPASRLKKYTLRVSNTFVEESKLKQGALIRFSIDNKKLENGCPRAFVNATLGESTDYHNISKTVAMMMGLTPHFNQAVTDELKNAPTPSWANRTDLTEIPFVTIDAVTTTDMDDAMWAEPDTNPKNPNGWHIVVAIADVAQYIKWNGEIDKEARNRGNTTYLPGYTCHMVPNELASDLCSLVPNEDRSCLAIHMWIDENGKLINKKLQRGVMNSRAKLHHTQVENAMKGDIDEAIAPHMENIKALYEAYKPLAKRAKKRGQLPIDSKEQYIAFDAEGTFKGIEMRDYMDINRVIEQFMVLANVAVAQLLIEKNYPGIYRIHEQPNEKAVDYWSQVLGNLGYHINPDKPLKQQLISILEKSRGTEEQDLVHMGVIRMQSKAQYSPMEDIGHYGLALQEYAHFTSPIRRYADLMVHRFLIHAFKLGEDGLSPKVKWDTLLEISSQISSTERYSQQAEREVRERFNAVWAEKEIIASAKSGEEKIYRARIVDIREGEGLIVEIKENGVQGFIPVESLPGNADYIFLHEFSAFGTRENIGENQGGSVFRELAFQRGASLDIQLVSADSTENSIVFVPKYNVCAIIEKYRDGIMKAIDKQFTQRDLGHDFALHGSKGRVSRRRKKKFLREANENSPSFSKGGKRRNKGNKRSPK